MPFLQINRGAAAASDSANGLQAIHTVRFSGAAARQSADDTCQETTIECGVERTWVASERLRAD